ncbi:MAG: 1-deoxy-D-xylulose-5-phosphate reductoisomerase [Alphaproteobacteria bacterium]|nr:1-deoxy-D-xylulose-5-phosphate reductoisomerase [Alphaproteobacteria bacterium]
MVGMASRSVTVLGSTGSVGESTIDLISRQPDRFRVVALTAHRNVVRLAAQARLLKPELAVIADPAKYAELKDLVAGTGTRIAAGEHAVIEAAALPCDWVMAAIVGAAGLRATWSAVTRGAIVALANKECLVSAGAVFMDAVKRHNAVLLPVDSEHNAIFQVFDARQRNAVRRLILTASGGPFRDWPRARMLRATPKEAVAHPNWTMGVKISVDSATMMNKGLELIEAHHLFGVPAERIDILVHPQSVVHSMVEYDDGSVLAQLGTPDMRTPIAYALGWPDRLHAPTERLDLARLASLTFENPDPDRFPALRLAREALKLGGSASTALNAANEVAVDRFLAGEIGFLDIAAIAERVLAGTAARPLRDLGDVLDVDADARHRALEASKRARAAE